MNIHYINRLNLDADMVCITNYHESNVKTHGISIRYYAGEEDGIHKVFASSGSKAKINQVSKPKCIDFHNFAAVVPLVDFNANIARDNIEHYLTNYKVTQ